MGDTARTAGGSPGGGRPRATVVVLVALVVAGVLVATAITLARPTRAADRLVATEPDPTATVNMRMTVDSIDAIKGVMRIRVAVSAGEQPLPPEGVTVFSNVDQGATVKLQPGVGPQEGSIDVPFTLGDIGDYPFDQYEGSLNFWAVKGTVSDVASAKRAEYVPVAMTAVDSTSGFTLDGNIDPFDNGFRFMIEAERRPIVVGWATVMMAVYWTLAFAVIAVTVTIWLRKREWESRHLAWLGAMIFALASFRATAPGSPPIGVFLDYAAFFWAEVLVVICLVGLVVFFLVGLPDVAAPVTGSPGPDDGSTAAVSNGEVDGGVAASQAPGGGHGGAEPGTGPR